MRNVQDLLQRAFIFKVLASGVRFPYAGNRQAMIEDMQAIAQHASTRADRWTRVASVWEQADDQAYLEEYHRLFVGGHAIALVENAYCDDGPEQALADVGELYTVFGFELSAAEKAAPDHLAIELEFYNIILIKLASAVSQAWIDSLAIWNAAQIFLRDHLSRWCDELRIRVLQREPAQLFVVLFEVMTEVVDEECEYMHVRPQRLQMLRGGRHAG